MVFIGALISIFLAIGITFIQGLSFFNIFQSVLSFIAPPMSVAFLFAVLWKGTSHKSINWVLSAGTVFSLTTGVLYYSNLIFPGVHFMYLSFALFILLSLFVFVFSKFEKKTDQPVSSIEYKPIKINGKVKVAWILLILVMIAIYLIFN